ncbi:MAG TPA: hypothetical protein VFF30_03615 [Nitrososphaerales archaeon]|nr:hypothetical protein [Nitrososphaerales archaeon]
MISASSAKKCIIGTVVTILILTLLEFPPPIGFETRPQSDVSPFWFAFFIAILVIEISVIPIIYRQYRLGAWLGILAAVLNVLQVVADQAHLMQPEVAPLGYSLLEGMVVIASIALGYFSWIVLESQRRVSSSPTRGNVMTAQKQN